MRSRCWLARPASPSSSDRRGIVRASAELDGRSGEASVNGTVGPEAVLDHIGPGADLILPLANGEPVALLDAIEAAADSARRRTGAPDARRCTTARTCTAPSGTACGTCRTSCPTSPGPASQAGTIDLVPNHFSEMRDILRRVTRRPARARRVHPARPPRLLLARGERRLRGVVHRPGPVLPRGQPRRCPGPSGATRSTSARSRAGPSATARCSRSRAAPSGADRGADRDARWPSASPTASTIQTGIGAIPNAILAALADHHDLGVHTELISDGLIDLVERGVVNGVQKRLNRTKIVGTFALGTRRLLRLPAREHRGRAVAGALRERPSGDRHRNRASSRSTPRSRSTSSASARPRRSAAATTRRAAARPTSPGARCTARTGRASSCSRSTTHDGGSRRSCPGWPPATS